MKLGWSFWANLSTRRKRIFSFLFIFVLIIIITIIGALVPTNAQQSKELFNQVNQTVTDNKASGLLAPSIFINNFSLCLLMFLPLLGCFIGLVIMFNTGYVIGAELRYEASTSNAGTAAASVHPSAAVLILALALATFLCEYVSYAIGVSESIWLTRRITQIRWGELKTEAQIRWRLFHNIRQTRWGELRRELKYTAILIGVVAVLLTIGAIVETYSLYLA